MSESPGEWSLVTIGGKSADVYEPPGTDAYESAVISLDGHGHETPAGDVVFTEQLAAHRLPCVCPHGGRSWWLDRLCRTFDDAVSPLTYVRERVVSWIDDRWNVRPPAIGLLGIGRGGQGALQLAYRDARTFPVVSAISPAVDFHVLHGQGGPLDEMFDSPEAARQQTATLHLHPLNWPPHQLIVCDPADALCHDGCERLASKLSSTGIPFEHDLRSSAGGGGREYYRSMAPRCVAFVAAGLQQVRSR